VRVFQCGVERGEEFPSGGDERDFERFTCSAQALIEGVQHRVAADCAEGSHIQCATHADASSGNMALPSSWPTIVVEGREPRECGDGAIGDVAQFWKMGEESSGSAGTDPLKGAKLRSFGGDLRSRFQESGDMGDCLREAIFDLGYRALQIRQNRLGEARDLPGGFGDEHGLQLFASRDPCGEFSLCWSGRGRGHRGMDLAKLCEHLRVNAVGFGPAAGSPSEVADLPGIDNGDGDLCCVKCLDDGALPTTGGLANHVTGCSDFSELCDQRGTSCEIMSEGACATLLEEIERGFGNIKSDVDWDGNHGIGKGSAL